MPQFFIERPVFAWVIAIFIVLFGAISLTQLPVERYPTVAPPAVNIYATYPGATPKTLNDSVVEPIEREISSVDHLLYFESSVDTSGLAQIVVTFEPGTNPEFGQVEVQNKLRAVEPRLPQMVRQIGLQVQAANTGFLLLVSLVSPDGRFDQVQLGDYLQRHIEEDIKRIPGVGRVQVFGSPLALRVWVDPVKLTALNISVEDIANAIRAQNAQISPGRLGDRPTVPGQRVTVPLIVKGELESVEDFKDIVLRANPDGSNVLLSDVAEVSLGPQTYRTSTRINGMPGATMGVQLLPGANAVETADAIHARLEELRPLLPEGIEAIVPYDTAPFVKISIFKVIQTFFEALLLVFLVMYLFLQSVRYTFIPAIVAPISILGTFAVMLALGFSVNVLTMFGMVLAIGIIVDDAIVVVENVERIMATEGLPPKQATQKAMREITGAVIGISLVLTAVFIPMAFASGSVGTIYRQFALSMAVAILFSAFLALSLTPALCATFLKPITAHEERRGFFGWFNRTFDRMTRGYTRGVAAMLKRLGRSLAVFAAIIVATAVLFVRLPGSFLPVEDQGYWMSNVFLPPDATVERTDAVIREYEEYARSRDAIETLTAIQGFGFSGAGPNVALMFNMLRDWDEREGESAYSEVAEANRRFGNMVDGQMMHIIPPAIRELGNSAGFAMRLIDRQAQGQERLLAAQATLLAAARESEVVMNVYPEGLADGPAVRLEIDRKKAQTLGVSFPAINSTISAAIGSMYVNDFPNQGRLQQVIIQARPEARMQIEDILALPVRNIEGKMIPLSTFATAVWDRMPLQRIRYIGYPAVRIAGMARPGKSSGEAMAEMERLVAEHLPPGYVVEWTGLSYQERLSGAEAPALLALSMLVVFLVLAALYESWSIPFSVMLVVPLGVLGALAAVHLRGLPNDAFFKVGLITLIGLSAKNAILIVEFAKQLEEQGRSTFEAALEAARLRLRPILMTSLAFTLGVVPLVISQGASAETQHAIGTGVFGGMLSGTILAIYLVPVFYLAIRKFFTRSEAPKDPPPNAPGDEKGPSAELDPSPANA